MAYAIASAYHKIKAKLWSSKCGVMFSAKCGLRISVLKSRVFMKKKQKIIYLDWNIFQDLKQDRHCEGLLENLLGAKKKGYIIPYSSAHLRDLSNCKNEKYIEEDIKFISELTDNWCIVRGKNDELLFDCVKYDPKKLFDEVNYNKEEPKEPLSQQVLFFNEYEVDISKIDSTNIILPYLKENNNIMSGSIINDLIYNFNEKGFDDYKLQKNFRTSFAEIVSLGNPANKALLDMPLYKYLLSSKDIVKNNFHEIISSFLNITNKSLDTIPHAAIPVATL